MTSKGVTRTGETYCLSCFEVVERTMTKCPSCSSDLTEEVKAFLCPKCKTVIALGEPQCPSCGLKFKVKTLRPKEPAEDDQFLMKLIEWGKAPPEVSGGEEAKPGEAPAQPQEDQLKKFEQLRESVKDLIANRSDMLERMEKRMEEEKDRLAQISSTDGEPKSSQQVEEEIMALAAEMADITMLQAHMESLADEITSLMGTVEISGEAKERGLAARALRMKLNAKEKELEELKAREEQLAKKEEMVDRKIQAYAAKKRQLDGEEEGLKTRLSKLEEERAELEKLKAVASGARTESEREEARTQWFEEQKKLKQRILGIKSTVTIHRTGKESTEGEIQQAEGDLDSMIGDLESQIATLINEKVDLQKKISEASAVDEDLRKLLKVLDQLLGQLPEAAVEKFSNSDDFALYERILDRLKI